MHGFLFINKRLKISCDTGIYAIILIHDVTELLRILGINQYYDELECHIWLVDLGFNITPTADVIWRQDLGLKFHQQTGAAEIESANDLTTII